MVQVKFRRGRRAAPVPTTTQPSVEVTIRPFRPDDLDGLFVLDYRCYARAFRFGYQQLLLTLQQADVTALVIEGGAPGAIVGGLIVRSEPAARRASVVSLMVEPELRRNGLGARLLGWVSGFARRSGWEAVVVPLERENEVGAAFLSAQGFADTGSAQPYFASSAAGSLWRLAVEDGGTPEP